jgi:hypothetical protein
MQGDLHLTGHACAVVSLPLDTCDGVLLSCVRPTVQCTQRVAEFGVFKMQQSNMTV